MYIIYIYYVGIIPMLQIYISVKWDICTHTHTHTHITLAYVYRQLSMPKYKLHLFKYCVSVYYI